MTYQNLGYWIGQANDLSTGRHPTGWTNGQRWSETAGEWIPMYDGMVGERDYWIGQYNAMVADRNYWKTTVAHDDPNVWTNRYNAGYSAGAASKTTSAVGAGINAINNLSGSYSVDISAVTAPRTGLAHCSAIAISNPSEDTTLHIFRNGALVVNGQNGAGGWNVHFAVQGNFNVNAGDYISIRATGSAESSIAHGYTLLTVGSQ